MLIDNNLLQYAIKILIRSNFTLRQGLQSIAIVVVVLLGTLLLWRFNILDEDTLKIIGYVLAGIAGTSGIILSAYQNFLEKEAQDRRIETVEIKARQHPEEPQLAWDLARIKLESYLDRNESQVASIFWLTIIVMFAGCIIICWGIHQSFQYPDKLGISIVAAASGIIISFLGGSFLIIYKAIFSQSKEYVMVLERINAVGMAVQVISSIPDENRDMKDAAMAELARQLLTLYAAAASTSNS